MSIDIYGKRAEMILLKINVRGKVFKKKLKLNSNFFKPTQFMTTIKTFLIIIMTLLIIDLVSFVFLKSYLIF